MEDNNETVGCVGDIEVVVETAAIPEEDVEKYLREEKEKEEQEEKEEENKDNVNREQEDNNGKVENE